MTSSVCVNKMERPARRILVGLAVLLTASTLLFTTSPYVARAHGLTSHGPILISGDSGFTSVNGVVNGSGTPSDPYLIAGWDINATGGPLPGSAIHVRNTHASFIIRDVLIHTSQSPLETSGFLPGNAPGGILLENAPGGTVENVQVTGPRYGIWVSSSPSSLIRSNNVWNTTYGIILTQGSDDSVASNNLVRNSTLYGMRIDVVNSVSLTGNNVTCNNVLCTGYVAFVTNNSIFDHNLAAGSQTFGFRILTSSDSQFRNNTILNNTFGFILNGNDHGNIVKGNKARGNQYGIGLEGGSIGTNANNTVSENILTNNTFGIYTFESIQNKIYDNYFDNTNNAFSDNGQNVWNTTKTLGRNILGGPLIGGNFYSDYRGSDPDGDGIGDTPYRGILSGNVNITNVDYLPLVSAQPSDIPPIADFSFNPPNLAVGQALAFNGSLSHDPDGSIVSYSWSFGDGSTASGSQVHHAYSAPGNFPVTLTVADNAALSGAKTELVSVIATSSLTMPIVGVWSQVCRSSNITLTDSACGPLSVNSLVSVEVNVTNAPSFNGYEFSLYYDPHFLKFNASDTKTGTIFANPFTAKEDSTLDGTYELHVIAVPGTNTAPSGTLVHVFFKVVGVGVSPLVLATGIETPSSSAVEGSWTRLVLGATPIDVATKDGYFKNDPVHLGPVASFTYSPSAPRGGQLITFDASNSYDPDNLSPGAIKSYIWDFGNFGIRGNLTTQTSSVTFSYGTPSAPLVGNFSVRLTVVDFDNHFEGMQVKRVLVGPSLSDIPPVARLTFSPPTPIAGTTVTFDGSQSFDPDGSVQSWSWNFGDNSVLGSGSRVFHSYSSAGNYTVTLTVTDNTGLTGTSSLIVPVHAQLLHDVGVVFVNVEQRVAVSGQVVNIAVGLTNNGQSNENVSVTAYYDSHIAASRNGISLPPNSPLSQPPFPNVVLDLSWNTTGVSPGNYIVSATVFLASDQNPANNHLSDGNVTILPPPTLTLTPSSGALGTQVVVHGSGFPTPEYGPSELFISFDDQFLGFAFPKNGTFTFTFNVPHADPAKPHLVKALDLSTGLTTSASFHVLPEPLPRGNLAVFVSVGTVYFPGDTSVIYVLTTLNGSPVGSGVQLQVQLFKPDGSTSFLSAVSVAAPGLYRAIYLVPKTATTGTYAVVAHASQGGQNAAGVGSFEVKPPWLATQSGRAITTGLALVGIVGLFAVAAWRGYRGREEEDT